MNLSQHPWEGFVSVLKWYDVFNNKISVLQAEVIRNGRIFAYKRIMFDQVIEVLTITPKN